MVDAAKTTFTPYQPASPEGEAAVALAHFRAIVESSDDAIISKTIDGIVTSWNPAATRMFGYSASEMVGQAMLRVFPQDRQEEEARILRKILAGERVNHFETVRQRKDGSVIHISVCISPIRDQSGRIVGASKIARDISNRLRLESTARQYEAIVASSDDCILSRSLDGCVMSWNAAAERMFGYSAAEIVGKLISQLIPEERQPEEIQIQELLLNGRKVDHFETVRQRKDGSLVDVSVTISPIRDEHQRIVGASSIVRDISEQKQAEYRLRMAASVFTHASEAIFITDSNGLILEVNDAFSAITGYDRREVLGRTAARVLDGGQEDGAYAALFTTLRSSEECRDEITGRRKDGSEYAVIATINRVISPIGGTRYVGLLTDITELTMQKEALRQLAHFDTLTGLPNRRLLLDRLQQALRHARRRGSTLALVYVDLDGFKMVNDTHGHAVGDILLTKLTAYMRSALREVDTLARIGGDEFVVLLVDIESKAGTDVLLERLLQACKTPVQLSGSNLTVSASLGVARYDEEENPDAETLLHRADQAMYRAKQAGKNQVVIWSH